MPSARASAILGNLDLWGTLCDLLNPSIRVEIMLTCFAHQRGGKGAGKASSGIRTLQTV